MSTALYRAAGRRLRTRSCLAVCSSQARRAAPLVSQPVAANGLCPGCGEPNCVTSSQRLCRRCHRLTHYGDDGGEKRQRSRVAHQRLTEVLKDRRCVVVKVVDALDFDGSFVPGIQRLIGPRKPVVLVCNKADLLPADANRPRIARWAHSAARRLGLRGCNLAEVHLVSGKSGLGMASLSEAMVRISEAFGSKGRPADLVVLGAANVGKSTVLNWLMRGSGKQTADALTVSPIPGTTLRGLPLLFGDKGAQIFDTPGQVISTSMALQPFMGADRVAQLAMGSPLSPAAFQMVPGKALSIGGLCTLSHLEGDAVQCLVYAAQHVPLKAITPEAVLEHLRLINASAAADESAGNESGTPEPAASAEEPVIERSRRRSVIPSASAADVTLSAKCFLFEGTTHKHAELDIAVHGLGWIAIKGRGNAKLRVHAPAGVGKTARPPLLPFN